MGLLSSDTKTNPYSEAEEEMHHKMMKVEGDSPDETFVRKMIEHHRGAIEVGRILLEEGADSELKEMTTKSIQHQQKEIGELQSWLQRHGRQAQ